MHELDIVTLFIVIFILIVIGFTIYGYIKKTSYSHYALGISIAGVLGLAYFTMSTKEERWSDAMGTGERHRRMRWNRRLKQAKNTI